MKKIIFISLAVMAMAVLFTSCGTPAQVLNQQKQKQELNEVIAWVNAAPNDVIRGYGSDIDTDENYAYRHAIANARSQVAQQIAAKIKDAIESYRDRTDVNVATQEGVKTKKDNEGKTEDYLLQLSNQLVSGAQPRETVVYTMPNGEIQVYIGVELSNNTLVEKIAAKKDEIQQAISEDQKVKIEYNRDKFKASLEEAFKE